MLQLAVSERRTLTSFHNVNEISARCNRRRHCAGSSSVRHRRTLDTDQTATHNGLLCFRSLSCGHQIVWPKVREPWPKERKRKRLTLPTPVVIYIRGLVPRSPHSTAPWPRCRRSTYRPLCPITDDRHGRPSASYLYLANTMHVRFGRLMDGNSCGNVQHRARSADCAERDNEPKARLFGAVSVVAEPLIVRIAATFPFAAFA